MSNKKTKDSINDQPSLAPTPEKDKLAAEMVLLKKQVTDLSNSVFRLKLDVKKLKEDLSLLLADDDHNLGLVTYSPRDGQPLILAGIMDIEGAVKYAKDNEPTDTKKGRNIGFIPLLAPSKD
jgi:hypothetical protein